METGQARAGVWLDMGIPTDTENRNWELINRLREILTEKALFLIQYVPGQICTIMYICAGM